ncbi:hypothetical protein [Rhizobium sp. K102]|uniref:hypothetical protein n=1 Tax=Rhizobium sp. K102 TaxID=2918527 RepID=UPI001EFC082B|nr:hypothetical protein [Rhizobium sp. K102]ULR46106.1 hypothetical protein MHI61_13400 [Rhizobium sp. K102]
MKCIISLKRQRRRQHLADQPRLFAEIIETITTRDQSFEDIDGGWGSKVTRPSGQGWRVADYSDDRKTHWMRRRPISWSLLSNGRRR